MHFTFLVIICASAARGGEEEGFRKGGWSTGPRADRANFYARGTCGETTLGRAQCGNPQLSTSKGGFKTATLQRCLAACDTCSACAFVSFSKRLETCLWFAECDMHQGTPRVQSESLYPHTHPAQTVCMRRGADQHCYGRAPHHLRAGVLMNKSQHAKHALFQTWDARLMPKRRAGIPALLCHAMHSSAAQARACSTIAPSTACQRLAIDLTNYTVITANCKPSLPLCNWTSLREHHQQIGARWIEDCPLAQCYKSHTNSTESQAITSCMKAASCYARRYPDLHAEYGSDSSKSSFLLYLHFLKHGKSEGRRFGCDESEDPKGNLAAESSRNAKAQWAIAETQHNRTVFPWACSLSQVSLTAGLVAPLDNTWSSSVAKRACKMPPPPCLNNNRGRKRPVRPLAFKRVLVSYAYYNPARSLNPHHLQCASNFRFLLDKLLPLDPSAELVVSVIGSSPWPLPDELNATGVRYRHARQLGVDAFAPTGKCSLSWRRREDLTATLTLYSSTVAPVGPTCSPTAASVDLVRVARSYRCGSSRSCSDFTRPMPAWWAQLSPAKWHPTSRRILWLQRLISHSMFSSRNGGRLQRSCQTTAPSRRPKHRQEYLRRLSRRWRSG